LIKLEKQDEGGHDQNASTYAEQSREQTRAKADC
jgi:hypothetical protein